MEPKQRAAEAALQFVSSGIVLGLGTGSTAKFFIQAVGRAFSDGKIKDIRCMPTSRESERLAREAGLPIASFAEVQHIDLTVDGADEIAPGLNLIKGLGGALLREKLVAQNSRRLIIIADQSKIVARLGTQSPLPVEVIPFGQEASERFLRSLGCQPMLRRNADGSPFVTDNGNHIFHCKFAGIDNPADLNQKLSQRAGIVESGLFLGLAESAIVADGSSARVLTKNGWKS